MECLCAHHLVVCSVQGLEGGGCQGRGDSYGGQRSLGLGVLVCGVAPWSEYKGRGGARHSPEGQDPGENRF